jgi:hypothetical protein
MVPSGSGLNVNAAGPQVAFDQLLEMRPSRWTMTPQGRLLPKPPSIKQTGEEFPPSCSP